MQVFQMRNPVLQPTARASFLAECIHILRLLAIQKLFINIHFGYTHLKHLKHSQKKLH